MISLQETPILPPPLSLSPVDCVSVIQGALRHRHEQRHARGPQDHAEGVDMEERHEHLRQKRDRHHERYNLPVLCKIDGGRVITTTDVRLGDKGVGVPPVGFSLRGNRRR